jgi:class 3 adenylate cyclase
MSDLLLKKKEEKAVLLVVDDSVENLQVLSALLKDDYRIKIAKNGPKALELARQEPLPDLILLDIVMPEMDGYAVCRQLKRESDTAAIPVIFLTALQEVADETLGFEVGGSDFISKPISPEIVKARIRTHLELRRERQRADQLLRVLLPEHVIQDLLQGKEHIPQIRENVSILFCDFVGFTAISSRLGPAVLIHELSEIFGVFDEIAERNDCIRIKTIGDAYLAAAGLIRPDEGHAEKLIAAALDFVSLLQQRNLSGDHQWTCRIGVHSGTVIGGIIGKTRFIYDIMGHDVNIAARVESAGEPMQVTITEPTARLLGSGFQVQFRDTVPLKGTDAMRLYTVTRAEGG